MADNTKIEWTDATWNPITGCAVVSPGCTNCYAMKLAGTRLKHHPSRKGLTKESKAGPVWTGEVRFNEEWLDQPLRWKRPRMIFVCAHGDLFAEGVPDDWIDQVFAVMALAPQHTFQVLTKRPERMREYMARAAAGTVGAVETMFIEGTAPHGWPNALVGNPRRKAGDPVASWRTWPLPNVWLGVSVEDQTRADERIPILLDTPTAVRWISAEPLLGPIDVLPYLFIYTHEDNARLTLEPTPDEEPLPFRDPATTPASDICTPRLDWVVAGGESGQGARPMHISWVRSLRDQCSNAGIPFHFKQWGVWFPYGEIDGDGHQNSRTRGEKCGVWKEWADGEGFSVLIGKKEAGRFLDGRTHDEFPR